MVVHNDTTPRRRRRWPLAVVVIGVVVALAGAAFAVVHTNRSGPGIDDPVPAEPIAVTMGEAFEFDGFSYRAGWDIRTVYGTLVVADLVTHNTGEDLGYPRIEIRLEQDSVVIARIRCSGSTLKPGGSTFLQCSSQDEVPTEYDRIVVADRH